MKTDELSYREITLNSRQLEVPREAYQRELNTTRVHRSRQSLTSGLRMNRR